MKLTTVCKERFSDLKTKLKSCTKRFEHWSAPTKVITTVTTLAICSLIIYLTVLVFRFFSGVGDTVEGVLNIGKDAIDSVVDIGRVTGDELNKASLPVVKSLHKWLIEKYPVYKTMKPIFVKSVLGLELEEELKDYDAYS